MIAVDDAIYEDGLIRLPNPLAIPDQTRVRVSIDPAIEESVLPPKDVSEDEVRAACDAIPDEDYELMMDGIAEHREQAKKLMARELGVE